MSFLRLLPRPRPVVLAGRTYLASELRLGDLADLEAFARDVLCPDVTSLPGADATDDELRTAFDAAETADATWGGEAANAIIFGTNEGRAKILGAALRDDPSVSEGTALVLAMTLDDAEWAKVETVAFGIDPRATLLERIDARLGFAPSPSEGVSWAKAIVETATALHWTIEAVAGLTLSQFRSVRNGGEEDDGNESGTMGQVVELAQKRKAFWEGQGAAPPGVPAPVNWLGPP